MQTAIGKSGADTAYRYEWAEPADIDEYGVATNIGSDRPSLEFIEAYDEPDTAPIIREHRVYHGSGADFDHFDHSQMGEGEGAQVYGWGTYVTEVKGIGEGYAIRSMNGSSMSHEVLAMFSGRRGAERLRAKQQKIMQGDGSVFENIAVR